MAYSKTGLVAVSLTGAARCGLPEHALLVHGHAAGTAASRASRPGGDGARCRRRPPRRQPPIRRSSPTAPGASTDVASITPGADPAAQPRPTSRRQASPASGTLRSPARAAGGDAADQVRRRLPRRPAALPGAGRRRQVVERRRQAAVALRRERLGAWRGSIRRARKNSTDRPRPAADLACPDRQPAPPSPARLTDASA